MHFKKRPKGCQNFIIGQSIFDSTVNFYFFYMMKTIILKNIFYCIVSNQ